MKKLLLVLGIGAVLIYIAATSFVAVDETEIVVITQLGKPIRVIENAGLAVKWPDPLQTTLRLDRRLQSLDSNIGEYLTKDKKNLVVRNFIVWRIADAMKFIRTVMNKPTAERRLADLVGSEMGVAIASYNLSELLTTEEGKSKIPDIANRVTLSSRKLTQEEFGIDIIDARIRRFGFPMQNLRSVYARMRAERERMARKYRAEGEEEAAKIRATTDKEVRELLADSYRDSQIKMGEGDAEAIKIYSDAYSKDPDFFKFQRTLDAYKKFMNQETTLILSADSPLFKYLETPPGEH